MTSENSRNLEDPECITVPLWPTAGKTLGLGKNSTYAAADRGEIPTLRFGGRRLVLKKWLQKLMDSTE